MISERKSKSKIVVLLLAAVMLANIFAVSNLSSTQAASAAVTEGVKKFQSYINTKLSSKYVEKTLVVDGSCGPATRTAAVKLVQQMLEVTVDGGFGAKSQEAYKNKVESIEVKSTGEWVYILQGLLYCNGYDCGGFDGSYGTGGGTACLNAVTKFKKDKGISESGGSVGIATICALLGTTVKGSESPAPAPTPAGGQSIKNGIKLFQDYINKNLPLKYLGKALVTDGSCGPATKTAAIKLVQYMLGVTPDGGFGPDSQKNFTEKVNTIEKGNTEWVYILQGLLFCNGYDCNGFDGKLGGGCLAAVRNFQDSKKIKNERGAGIETISLLLWTEVRAKLSESEIYDENSKLLLSFAAMSDAHVQSNAENEFYRNNLKHAFEDINKLPRAVDAVIVSGDLTHNGYANQYDGLKYALGAWKNGELFLCMGNHDAGRYLDGGYEEGLARFTEFFNGIYSGIVEEKPYYDKYVGGFHFIVMSTEDALWDEAYISDEQLTRLDEKLAADTTTDPTKPVFVVCHWPLNNSFERTEQSNNDMGAQSDALQAILEKYPQTILMSGHAHNGFTGNNCINDGKGVKVLLPTLQGGKIGYNTQTSYYLVLVYEDRIEFRARDYGNDVWLPRFDFVINIGTGE